MNYCCKDTKKMAHMDIEPPKKMFARLVKYNNWEKISSKRENFVLKSSQPNAIICFFQLIELIELIGLQPSRIP